MLQAPFPPPRAQVRHGTPSESHAAVHAIHKLLILIKESGHAEIQHSWWAELVVTFKTLLEQPAHREQAEPNPNPNPNPNANPRLNAVRLALLLTMSNVFD